MTRVTLRMDGAISSKKGGGVSPGNKKLCTECRSMRPLTVSRPVENRLPSNHKGPEKKGELTNEAAMKKQTVTRLNQRSK